ncbi:MAG: hypothetical protein J1E38_06560 [Paramuribaculum sp.]|nr:hypothetical protein [Paramuribaculum sp.]
MNIKELGQDAKIEILGHTFDGLQDIESAVEITARVRPDFFGDRRIERNVIGIDPEGIHVLDLYMPYPCFDSSDFLYENRKYHNYFFSKEPFTDKDIERIAGAPMKMNYCLVHEEMDENLLPAVYFCGDSYCKLIVATK